MPKKQPYVFDAGFLAERIREVVASNPKALAFDIGGSLSAVYNYMHGRVPKIGVLVRIARARGKTLDWFFREFQPNDEEATRSHDAASPQRAVG